MKVVRRSDKQVGHGLGPLDEAGVHRLEQDEELRRCRPGTACRGCGRRFGRRAWSPRSPGASGRARSASAAAGTRRSRPCAGGHRGSRARCGSAACPPRSGRTCLRCGSRRAAPWRCSRATGRSAPRCSGRAGWPGLAWRVSASGACRAIRSSQLCLVSSMAAHSSPRGLTPAALNTSSATRTSALPMPLSPSASASRLAGSTVSTSTRPPCSAAAMAATEAAVVVLPTPPGPQAMAISLALSSWLMVLAPGSCPARCRASQCPSSSPSDWATWWVVRRPWVRVNRYGNSSTGRSVGQAGLEALEVGRAGCGAW